MFVFGTLYHCVATIYGLEQQIFGKESHCIELQMFKDITCTIYTIWFCGITLYILAKCFCGKKRSFIIVEEGSYAEVN